MGLPTMPADLRPNPSLPGKDGLRCDPTRRYPPPPRAGAAAARATRIGIAMTANQKAPRLIFVTMRLHLHFHSVVGRSPALRVRKVPPVVVLAICLFSPLDRTRRCRARQGHEHRPPGR